MSLIICTEEGIQIDGVLLKDNVDLKAYIAAHAPSQVEVTIGVNKPSDLEVSIHKWQMRDLSVEMLLHEPAEFDVYMGIHSPYRLETLLGVNPPRALPVYIGGNLPYPLLAVFHPAHLSDYEVALRIHVPSDFYAQFRTHLPHNLMAYFGIVPPHPLYVPIEAVPPHPLYWPIQPYHIAPHLYVNVKMHDPYALYLMVRMHPPEALYAVIDPIPPHPLNIEVGLNQPIPLYWIIQPWHESPTFTATVDSHDPKDLWMQVMIHDPHVLNAYITALGPPELPVQIGANQPYPLIFLLHYWHFRDTLHVQFKLHEPYPLQLQVSIHKAYDLIFYIALPDPMLLWVPITPNPPVPLYWVIQPWHVYDSLAVYFDLHLPHAYQVVFDMHQPHPLDVGVDIHSPSSLEVPMGINQAYPLYWDIQPWHVYDKLQVLFDLHAPHAYQVVFDLHLPYSYVVEFDMHQPYPLQVEFGLHTPYPLYVYAQPYHTFGLSVQLGLSQPADLNVEFGLHLPYPLNIDIGLNAPFPLDVYIGLNQPYPLQAYIGGHNPEDLLVTLGTFRLSPIEVFLGIHIPSSLITHIGINQPYPLSAQVGINAAYPLDVDLWIWSHSNLYALIACHSGYGLSSQISMHSPNDLYVILMAPVPPTLQIDLGINAPYVLYASLWPVRIGNPIYVNFTLHSPYSLDVSMGLHEPSPLSVPIGGNLPFRLNVLIARYKSGDTTYQVDFKLHAPYSLIAYLFAYKPEWAFEVTFGLHQPYPLNVPLGVQQPYPLYIFLNQKDPEDLYIDVGVNQPYPLTFYMYIWQTKDFSVYINQHSPADLSVNLGEPHAPAWFWALVDNHLPKALTATFMPIPYHKLTIFMQPYHVDDRLYAIINSHAASLLQAAIAVNEPEPLYAYIRPMYCLSFKAWFFTVKFGDSSFRVFVKVTRAEHQDLDVLMHIWSLKQFAVTLKGHAYPELTVYTWVWTPADIQVAIDTHFPGPLEVGFSPQPEDGVDLRVIHGFYKYTGLSVDFGIWTEFYNFRASIWGVYTTTLDVVFRMGGSSYLQVPLPMTTGYRNLFVTCKPASRIMTTIIPVYTIEIRDLYISINQGWPCGFGSSYKLLDVSFRAAYFHAFTAVFKVIHGSGTDLIGVFVNRAYFDTYINKFDIHIRIPEEDVDPETYISDKLDIVYDNEFADLYQDIVQVTFSWPRIRLWSGDSNFSVELFPYKGDKEYGLSVLLYAQRQLPVRQLTSKPLMPKEEMADPIWPDVFQVTEIELWGDDPPEVVRKVEIKFEEQIHEYYWVSSEQKAMSKRVYERWAFLTRGYLPSAEYSGQIDYLTMRSLSSMKRYDTIDAAVKAMIANFLYSGKTSFKVSCLPHGGYSPLLIGLTIRDYNHLRNLRIIIEPMHTQSLSVNLTAI